MPPTLSVIIPFHNIDLYLAACLDSVVQQSFDDLEIIVVDDGSTDTSREIAAGFQRKDDRVRLLCQDNRGPGVARNIGLREASGQYVAFADADDIVAEHAYSQLVGSLRRTGSDFACGGVRRFNRDGSWPSPLHEGIFDRSHERTHITTRPELLGDRTAWNKVYRRSFWDRHGFAFPDQLFEDALVTVSAHVLADAVDVVVGPVYYWRQRDDGPPSITQRALDANIIDGRMKQISTVSGFLAESGPELKRAYDLVALEHDVLILLNALPGVDRAQRECILSFAHDFTEGLALDLFAELDDDNAECYQLLRERRLDDLLQHLARRPRTDFL